MVRFRIIHKTCCSTLVVMMKSTECAIGIVDHREKCHHSKLPCYFWEFVNQNKKEVTIRILSTAFAIVTTAEFFAV
jgi:hypothetical protein